MVQTCSRDLGVSSPTHLHGLLRGHDQKRTGDVPNDDAHTSVCISGKAGEMRAACGMT